jgi:hypothetical protein
MIVVANGEDEGVKVKCSDALESETEGRVRHSTAR